MDPVRWHLLQGLLVLRSAQADLEEGRAVVDPMRLQAPEDDPCELGGQVLVRPVVVERPAQDVVGLRVGQALERLETGLQPHLLREAVELLLGLLGPKAQPALEDGDSELQDALRADPQGVMRQGVLDQEVVAELLLIAEMAGLRRFLVILNPVGERPLLERLGERLGNRQGQDVRRHALRIAHAGNFTSYCRVRHWMRSALLRLGVT